jgi:hypothetical protein
MSLLVELLKKFGVAVLVGTVSAGVVLFVVSSDDLVGAADGNSVKKKKIKNNKNVWEEVVKEVASPPSNSPKVNSPLANNSSGSSPVIPPSVIPEDSLLDKHDPDRCARNTRRYDRDNQSRTLLAGEIRAVHQKAVMSRVICEVELYPAGCDSLYYLKVVANRPDHPVSDPHEYQRLHNLCGLLSEAAFSKKTLHIAARQMQGEQGVQGSPYLSIFATSLWVGTFDAFEAKARAIDEEIETITAAEMERNMRGMVNNMFPR